MYRFAGILRIDPDPFTFGELWGMAKASEIDEWDRTAATIATIVGLVKKNIRVEDFHPYRKGSSTAGVPATAENLKALKGLFSQPWQPS